MSASMKHELRQFPAARSGAQTWYLLVICLVAATGGLLFGFDTAVISGTVGLFRAEFELSAARAGWVASSALVGCMAGALVAGTLSDRFGRKKALLLSAACFTVSAIGCALAHTADSLVVARLLGGVGIGIASILSPMYIAEVSPPAVRGRLVALQQLAIVLGILAAYFSNSLILGMQLSDGTKWRWMFGAGAVPALVFLGLLIPVPESPRWLIQKGALDAARAVLAQIAGAAEADLETARIAQAIAAESGSFSELLKPGLRRALWVGVALAVLTQVTGINAIMYYAPEIFKQAGSSVTRAFNDTVWIGLTNLVFTVVSMALVDRCGRRLLLLWGASAMGISLGLIGLAFHLHASGLGLLVLVMAYVGSFSVSMGVVGWVVISEIYPTRTRGRAMAVAVVALWGACYLVSQTFLVLVDHLGSATTFWCYGVLCVVAVLFVCFAVPETRGRSLEEIERMWLDHEAANRKVP